MVWIFITRRPYRVVIRDTNETVITHITFTRRFPECTFSVQDALSEKGTAKLRELCKEKLVNGYPTVVAIDINGNREVPAVLQCIENVMAESGE